MGFLSKEAHGVLRSSRRILTPNFLVPAAWVAAESGKVPKRFNTRNEKVGSSPYCCEGGKALYLLSDGTLWNCKVKRAILGADHRIVLITELVEIWIVDPNVLDEFELTDEACADHKRRNPALDSVLGRILG